MFDDIISAIREIHGSQEFIPLHIPQFHQIDKRTILDCIDSTFVSSVGKYVDQVEEDIASYCGAKRAIAVSNGTSALHLALHALGVDHNSEVITQPLTFIATANAISYTGAKPVFIDVEVDTMGLSPEALEIFLILNCKVENGSCINKKSGRAIKACVPMHTFGFPCRIEEIAKICTKWNIELVEDAAESLGSYVHEKHTGIIGKCGTLSFNGNKIITSGGGGMILTDDDELANRLKHLSTTAKIPHSWEYEHDEIGFNYRMPNLNAALLHAQFTKLENYLEKKRDLAESYQELFKKSSIKFISERSNTKANYWLNTVMFNNLEERNLFLKSSNDNGIMTRPIWQLISSSKMYSGCQKDDLENSIYLADRIVNLPSTPQL